MTVLCITFNISYTIICCSLFSLCLLGFSLGTLASAQAERQIQIDLRYECQCKWLSVYMLTLQWDGGVYPACRLKAADRL